MNYQIGFYRHLLKFRFCSSYSKRLVDKATKAKKCLVPKEPIKSRIDLNKLPPKTRIDAETIAHLERLSLVNCANRQGIETLEEAIAFADRIHQVDTTGVEPMITVWEDIPLSAREDKVTEGNCKQDILKNATVTEEDYFVAPPGNIPLEPREDLLHEKGNPGDSHKHKSMKSFNKVIDICEKNGFLKRYSIPRVKENMLRIGPIGSLLQERLRTEWLQNTVVNKEYSVFLHTDGDFSDTFNMAKDLCLQTLPFGVASFSNRKVSLHQLVETKENVNTNVVRFKDFFENHLVMNCVMFVSPHSSLQLFHQWQRQRKIWWRKFSASPGRYSLTDIHSDEQSKMQTVDIKAKYPWGEEIVETIELMNSKPLPGLLRSQLEFKDGRKLCQADSIVSRVCLSTMCLNSLCDAYEEPIFQGESRPLFRFHRKIAPYKISFAISGSQKSITDDLRQLALYLCKQLRTNSVPCLLIPTIVKFTLEAQFKLYDQIGVPYTVVLNEKTLKDGITYLRSRDTTLKEQVHVTNLLTYVEQLFKNY